MARDRKGSAGGSDRKRASAKAPEKVEPGLVARLVGDNMSTLLTVGGIITVLTAWVIWDKTNIDGATIPWPLWVYLAVGLAILGVAFGVKYLLADQVELVNRRRRALKDGKALAKEARRILRRKRAKLKPDGATEIEAARDAVVAARRERDFDKLADALGTLDRKLDEHAAFARKSQLREYTESIAIAVAIALLLRAFVIEAFKIPSGSMIPTLLVGDHIFVNKFIYGVRLPWPLDETAWGSAHQKFFMNVRKPKRGEVIVFKYPRNPDQDFIKRIIAVEGDTVEIKNNVVYVNDKPVPREHVPGECEYDDFNENTNRWEHKLCDAWREHLDGHDYVTFYDRGGGEHSWPKREIPPGTVFCMGDNRDNSHDSRYWGTVPFELIKGKAIVIWWSSGEPEGIRVKRMGHLVE